MSTHCVRLGCSCSYTLATRCLRASGSPRTEPSRAEPNRSEPKREARWCARSANCKSEIGRSCACAYCTHANSRTAHARSDADAHGTLTLTQTQSLLLTPLVRFLRSPSPAQFAARARRNVCVFLGIESELATCAFATRRLARVARAAPLALHTTTSIYCLIVHVYVRSIPSPTCSTNSINTTLFVCVLTVTLVSVPLVRLLLLLLLSSSSSQ